jgi:hypothetical protein
MRSWSSGGGERIANHATCQENTNRNAINPDGSWDTNHGGLQQVKAEGLLDLVAIL